MQSHAQDQEGLLLWVHLQHCAVLILQLRVQGRVAPLSQIEMIYALFWIVLTQKFDK